MASLLNYILVGEWRLINKKKKYQERKTRDDGDIHTNKDDEDAIDDSGNVSQQSSVLLNFVCGSF